MSAACKGSWPKTETPVFHLTSDLFTDFTSSLLLLSLVGQFGPFQPCNVSLLTVFSSSYDQECWYICMMTMMHCVIFVFSSRMGEIHSVDKVEWLQSRLCTLSSVMPEGRIAILRSEWFSVIPPVFLFTPATSLTVFGFLETLCLSRITCLQIKGDLQLEL